MSYIATSKDDLFSFDPDLNKEKGLELQEQYLAGKPFPHIYIDDFLPEETLRYCLDHFPTKLDPDGRAFDRDQERYKASFNPDYFTDANLKALFYAFNSRPFIHFMENLTGIGGLIPDPYFMGAGFHEIGTGGHLSVHADFNLHRRMNLERRVNILIYLNEDWKPEYGGQLELWDLEMKNCVQSIVPLFNRCAVFSTTSTSWHGNPNPINHPDGRTRRSIALYYYTATWDEKRQAKTTQFKVRPGSEDKVDWHVRTKELTERYLPGPVARRVNNLILPQRRGDA